jgi:hypothetical protein
MPMQIEKHGSFLRIRGRQLGLGGRAIKAAGSGYGRGSQGAWQGRYCRSVSSDGKWLSSIGQERAPTWPKFQGLFLLFDSRRQGGILDIQPMTVSSFPKPGLLIGAKLALMVSGSFSI